MSSNLRRLTPNLLNLSDAFRRNARFTKPEAAKELSKLTRRLAIHLTYYRGEEAESHLNKELVGKVRQVLREISEAASDAGLSKITLPVRFDKDNSLSVWLKKEVMKGQHYPVPFDFMKQDYKTDLSYLGDVNRHVRTVFDRNVRGIVDIDSRAKSRKPSV